MRISPIEHADALDWLASQEPGAARAIIFDPRAGVGRRRHRAALRYRITLSPFMCIWR